MGAPEGGTWSGPIFAPQVRRSSQSNSSSCDTVLEILYYQHNYTQQCIPTQNTDMLAIAGSISLHFTPQSHCISHLASLACPYMCKRAKTASTQPTDILLFSLQPPDCCTNTTKETISIWLVYVLYELHFITQFCLLQSLASKTHHHTNLCNTVTGVSWVFGQVAVQCVGVLHVGAYLFVRTYKNKPCHLPSQQSNLVQDIIPWTTGLT